MNKKLFVLLLVGILHLGLWSAKDMVTDENDKNDDYLNIFIPYHSVKSVFAADCESDTEPTFSRYGSRRLQRQLTQEEMDLIAKIVQGESEGEPFEGKVGVAAVIFNRLDHPSFPKSIEDVVFEKNAFSCVDEYDTLEADAEAYRAVDEALSGKDPTDNAVFFYNPRLSKNKWMKSTPKSEVITIGNHVFFK